MSLFGKKCVRCGKTRTRNQVEGLPTCDACELVLTAKREMNRKCPIDGTPMDKAAIQKIIIDRCPTCKGIWLDGGELDILRRISEKDTSGEFTRGFLWGMFLG